MSEDARTDPLRFALSKMGRKGRVSNVRSEGCFWMVSLHDAVSYVFESRGGCQVLWGYGGWVMRCVAGEWANGGMGQGEALRLLLSLVSMPPSELRAESLISINSRRHEWDRRAYSSSIRRIY